MKNLEVENKVKYALLIEYNGNGLVGWQKQDEGVSVQGSLEKAAKSIFNEKFEIQGSGRTDAGVHALGQVAHIYLPKNHKLTSKHPFYIISAFNALLKGRPAHRYNQPCQRRPPPAHDRARPG